MPLQFLDEGNYYKICDEKGNICLIDKEDRIKIEKYNWKHSRGYWIAVNPESIGPQLLTMHRIIMEAKENEFIDHRKQVKNGFTDNRKQNLRK